MEQIDRPNTHHWPPIIYAVTLLAAWGLERIRPLDPLPAGLLISVLGGFFIAAGIAVAVAGLLRFRAHGTAFDPTGPASALATDGIYRITRNPMYVGAVSAFAGLALVLRLSWLLVLLPLMVVALRRLAIDREEAYLERRFGQAYRDYRDRVRRWL